MKHASLAALYRPQTFAQVTGQEMVTAVLSRAAAEDRVAPAYLLSGTRGVGKTTIARILAKALNCVNAPGPEPCNQCEQCRKITQGSHVDVTEIDGASNNSVEDARALRENIGYAPMEGRYKVFIIDEAHMLSRSAFNALLKTLEEPPPRVVFVFATTEAHKFPITIVSRCQHFIFKRLPEATLVGHLTRVLHNEGLPFDPAAVLLIARRAAGSVRDSMSLLGQTLALGGQGLSVEATRSVLGLAGQELFVRLLEALAAQDCVAVTQLVGELLDQGADIGFFLRELTSLWRTLFLLRQAGQAVLPSLGLPEDEAQLWLGMAPRFSLSHIHAAWHMVLDAQRKVIHSPEPAAALELLLLNLALMPRLLPLERVSSMPEGAAAPAPLATTPAVAPLSPAQTAPQARPMVQAPAAPAPQPPRPVSPVPAEAGAEAGMAPCATPPSSSKPTPVPEPAPKPAPVASPPPPAVPEPTPETRSASAPGAPNTASAPGANRSGGPTWEDFCTYCADHGKGLVQSFILSQTQGVFSGSGADNELRLSTESGAVYERLERLLPVLRTMAGDYTGVPVEILLSAPTRERKTEAMLKEEFAAREELQPCMEILDASLARVRPLE